MANQPQQSTKARLFVGWLTSMFSVEGKMRANAKNWLELAEKVYHYRRDVITQVLAAELQSQITNLRKMLKERTDAAKLKLGIEELEGVMRRTGGKIYPKSTVQEYVEFFLVAAIVVLGIRTYFVQPFKIPTNSMWPSYNGMTPQVYQDRASEPSFVGEVFRLISFGASAQRIDAPADGEIMVAMNGSTVPFREVSVRKWLFFPTTLKEYTLLVGEEPVTIRVPLDFDFEWLLRDAFFPDKTSSREPGRVDLARALDAQRERIKEGYYLLLRTGKHVRKGERVLSFDIMTGDQLFVDRISYHFVRPQVGSAFVFRTDNIHSSNMIDRRTNEQIESYYIKRLVGTPGDQLYVSNYTLYRNGVPATGSSAFADNANRAGNYVGYRQEGLLEPGKVVTVEPKRFFAMGDNSANSGDSRFWGFVPNKDVVGRPLFIYYPFTKHWGPAP